MRRHARQIAGVGARDRVQHEHRVLHAARHRAELVERPAQRHRAAARHSAERRTQTGDAAAHRWRDDAAAGLAADRESDESRGRRRAGTGARARRAFLEQPRIHRLTAEPDVVERERAEAELRDQHCAGLVESRDDGGVGRRNAIAVELRAVGRRNAGRVEEILPAPRDAVQRAAILSRRDLGVGLLRLRERVVARERDDAAKLGIEALNAIEIDVGEARRRQFLRLDPARQPRHRRERDVIVGGREGCGVRSTAHEPIARGADFLVRKCGIPLGARSDARVDGHLPRPGAALEQEGHRRAPARRGHRALRVGQRDLRELLRFGECRRATPRVPRQGRFRTSAEPRECSELPMSLMASGMPRRRSFTAARGGGAEQSERRLDDEITA